MQEFSSGDSPELQKTKDYGVQVKTTYFSDSVLKIKGVPLLS